MIHQTLKLASVCAIVALVLFLIAEPATAQCVMCRASLAGDAAFVRKLNLGVLVLLAPPVSIFCVFFFIAFRHRK